MSFLNRLLCFNTIRHITAYTENTDYFIVAELSCFDKFTDPITASFFQNPQREAGRTLMCQGLPKSFYRKWQVFAMNDGSIRLSDPFRTRPACVHFKGGV